MIRKTLYLLGRSRRRRWVLVILLAVLRSFLEVVGAALILLLLTLIVDPDTAVTLPIIGDFLQVTEGVDDRDTLVVVAVGIATFFVARAVIKLMETYIQQRVVHQAGLRLSAELVEGYLGMPYVWHLGRNSAELIRNLHEAVNRLVTQVFLPSIRIVTESLILMALLTVLFVISPTGTMLAIAVLGPIALLLMAVVQPALKRLGRSTHETVGRYFATVQQSLTGIRDVKILGRERFFARQFVRDRAETARARYLKGALTEVPRVLIETSLLLLILGFFALAVGRGETAASVLPVLGVFAYAGLRMQPSLQNILAGINNLRFATAPIDEVYQELQELDRAGARRGVAFPDALLFEEEVTFEDVSFRYENTSAPALSNVNLRIAKGESIGVCGPTGGGKTTLVDLLAGLLDPTSGTIRVDGQDLRGQAREWQQNLGVVPQSVFLLDDTLRRNIAFGIPDEEIDESAVVAAVRLAQLSEFVGSLPEGLETRVGERGVRISGGQRQRVAIARSLYRKPSVLIFDEGTSALDSITEAELIGTLDSIRGERTTIIVAHRLTTVRGCDRIVLVTGGRIADIGDYDELLARSTEFRQLAELG